MSQPNHLQQFDNRLCDVLARVISPPAKIAKFLPAAILWMHLGMLLCAPFLVLLAFLRSYRDVISPT